MRRWIIAAVATLAGLALAGPAAGATGTLFGGATLNPDGSVTLVSDLSDEPTENDFSGINFGVNVPFQALTTLSTQYNVTDDDCRGGSPRFQLNVEGANVFVYLGPSPSFTGCAQNTWLGSGNLVGNDDACRWDTSQLAAGTQCNTYSGALALLSGKTITGIQLVVDSGWAFEDREQTVIVRNVRINGLRLFGPLNPARACRAQQAAMGAAPFRELYGTNRNKANAFGMCVSAMARAQRNGTAAAVQTATVSAARACRAERQEDADAFRATYGTNPNRANAFGRCVSAKARAQQQAAAATTTTAPRGTNPPGKGRAVGRP
jgi:hypothetical protein